MAYPATTVTNGTDADNLLVAKATAAGLTMPTGGLSMQDYLAYAVGNLMTDLPSGINAPNLASGTGIGGSAAAASTYRITKTVTALADTVATNVLTITVPNVKANAMVRVTLLGSLGAGGAIGAGEAFGNVSYDFSIGRTAGVNATGLISSVYGSSKNAVAGAATITVAGALSSVSGAVGASNTFTVTCAITKSGGSSDNHVCVVSAEVLNAFASGITIA